MPSDPTRTTMKNPTSMRDFVPAVHARQSVAVQFGKNGHGIQMVVPEDGEPYRLDKSVVRWIVDRVGIGDVVYDLAAGPGLYTVIAARHRGATVVAFEPGYAAYKDLCDNLLLNGCDGAVAPLPVALADFEGFGRLKFPLGHPGQSRHAVHAEPWKPRRPAGEGRPLVQPVCATSLDRAVERYELPPANHLRIGNLASVRAVIDGAAATLALRSLQTVFVTMLDADREWASRAPGGPRLQRSDVKAAQARSDARDLRQASVRATPASRSADVAVSAMTSVGR